ncbi:MULTISPECIES: GMP synthase [Pseudomonas]|uniref:glutamine amidotransferase-related protein n=1 Tax=Pseudomonas TaxID=286 RepID=UPI0013A78B72|nr:GMP synthase [Pseudomonas sp. OIL-1]QIB52244.1 GMP synthase [Pseudomonas sp. OIL-1]
MKIGILQCDDVTENLQPNHGNYPDMLLRRLEGHVRTSDVVIYRTHDGELPVSIDECDGYLTTGSRFSVYDPLPWIEALETFLIKLWEAKKPLVGICFGHQLIARALGGEVERSEKGWGVGVSFNQLVQRRTWMDPWQDKLDLVVSHQDQVVELPDEAEVLVKSDFCEYYVVQYGDHFLSIQGHPEFSKEYSRDLMAARQGIIPDVRLRAGNASLSADVDGELMTKWMVNFMHEALVLRRNA